MLSLGIFLTFMLSSREIEENSVVNNIDDLSVM